jgi:hypothetical protein
VYFVQFRCLWVLCAYRDKEKLSVSFVRFRAPGRERAQARASIAVCCSRSMQHCIRRLMIVSELWRW